MRLFVFLKVGCNLLYVNDPHLLCVSVKSISHMDPDLFKSSLNHFYMWFYIRYRFIFWEMRPQSEQQQDLYQNTALMSRYIDAHHTQGEGVLTDIDESSPRCLNILDLIHLRHNPKNPSYHLLSHLPATISY